MSAILGGCAGCRKLKDRHAFKACGVDICHACQRNGNDGTDLYIPSRPKPSDIRLVHESYIPKKDDSNKEEPKYASCNKCSYRGANCIVNLYGLYCQNSILVDNTEERSDEKIQSITKPKLSDGICIVGDESLIDDVISFIKNIFKRRKDIKTKNRGGIDMGFKMEFNWYLVGEATNMTLDDNNKIVLTKNEERVYPRGHRVPVILKETGCLGFAIIDSVLITENRTVVGATLVEELPKEVAEHYYQQWKNTVPRGHSSTTLP